MTTVTGLSRAELAAEVARLRGEGLFHREVAERLGISRGYAVTLDSDPDGEKQRTRRESYQGVCERCGGVTKSSGTSKPSRTCATCSHEIAAENARWTPETITAAIQQFAREHGRPPLSTEWAVPVGDGGRSPDYPANSTVLLVMGSWADAVEAAGFERPRVGRKVPRERIFVCEDCGEATRRPTSRLELHLCDPCLTERRRLQTNASQHRYRQRTRTASAA